MLVSLRSLTKTRWRHWLSTMLGYSMSNFSGQTRSPLRSLQLLPCPPCVCNHDLQSTQHNMKCGPSGIVAEVLKAAGEEGVELVRQLTEAVFSCGVIPSDWEESFILNLSEGKDEALGRGSYCGLKLTDQVMTLLELVLEFFIREMVNIDEMQCYFVPGRGTTDAIFIVRQLQEKLIAATKLLYFAFVDLEKVFDPVPRKVLWWAWRSPGMACHSEHVPQVPCGSMVSTVRSLVWEIVRIRVLSLAHSSSFWYWRHSGVSSALCTMGASLCWWPGAHRVHPRWVYLHAQGMEGWHEKYRALCQHEEDQVPDL